MTEPQMEMHALGMCILIAATLAAAVIYGATKQIGWYRLMRAGCLLMFVASMLFLFVRLLNDY